MFYGEGATWNGAKSSACCKSAATAGAGDRTHSLTLSGLVTRTPSIFLKGKQEGDGVVVTRSDNGVAGDCHIFLIL